jgi:hypothetical protein
MKTIFTSLLLLLLVVSSSFAQQKITADTKSTFASVPETQLYSISKIYPNPAIDWVNIDLKATNPESIRISLFNIMGIEVKIWTPINIPAGGQLINLDLSEFKSGVYILKFTNGSRIISQVIRKS